MEKVFEFTEYLESKLLSIVWRYEFMALASLAATIVSYHIIRIFLTFLKLGKENKWNNKKNNPTEKQEVQESTEQLRNRLKLNDKMEQVILALYGEKWAAFFKKVYTYVVLTRNPIGIIMYIYLTVGGYSLAVYLSYGVFVPGPYISEYNLYVLNLMITMCWYSFIKACYSEPGECDANSHETGGVPYDNLMYKPGVECQSCKIIKPARSKHCSVCRTCRPLFDHHCFWINTCVTHNNFGSFMFFLATHCILVIYVCYLTFWAIRGEILNQGIIFEDLVFKEQV